MRYALQCMTRMQFEQICKLSETEALKHIHYLLAIIESSIFVRSKMLLSMMAS